MNLEVAVGHNFKTVGVEVYYTVTNVTVDKKGITIDWDCIGRKHWYRKVNIATIHEWLTDGRLERAKVDVVEKARMVHDLKPRGISDITSLWGNAKAYADRNGFEMGGGKASVGTDILVRLRKGPIDISFKVHLSEVKTK